MRCLTVRRWSFFPFLLAVLLVVVPVASAQDSDQDEEPTEAEIRRNFSLYNENYNNENYERAVGDMEWILEHAPGFPNDSDLNFRRAVRVYEALALETDDSAAQQEYIEKAWDIFDAAPERFEELNLEHDTFAWTRNKGRFLELFGDELGDVTITAKDAYVEAFEMDPQRLDPYFIEHIIEAYIEEGERDAALDFMDRVEEHRSEEPEIAQLLTDVRDELFDSPEERYEFITDRLEDDPDNVELLREQFDLAQTLGHRQAMFDIADRLLELEPNAESYLEVAEMYLNDGEEEQALTYLERALQQEDVDQGTQRRDIYHNMGTAERRLGNLQAARDHLRQALEEDSNYGPAYMGIAEIYASAVSECSGQTLERQDRAVYWLVIDYLEQAAAADPNVASSAERQIQTYLQVAPSQEDVFFHAEWQEGGTVNINFGCYSWINETTRVRV